MATPIFALILSTRLAQGDVHEAQWSARPLAGIVQLGEERTDDRAFAALGGLALGVSYGLSNGLDLGAELVTFTSSLPTFGGATVTLDGGAPTLSPLTRRTSSVLAMMGPTWRFGIDWVSVVTVEAGAGVRYRSAGRFPEFGLVPAERTARLALDLVASGRVGIERRVNRRLTVGGYLTGLAGWGPSAPLLAAASLGVGVSYVHYPRF